MANVGYPGLDRVRRMLQEVALAWIERLGIHPDQGCKKVCRRCGGLVGGGEHLSPANVQLILERERDGHGRHGPAQITVKGGDALDPAGSSRGKSDDAVARPD